MNNQAFSKIWVVIILVILIAGGILAWQYWLAPKEKGEVPEKKVVVPSSEKDCQILEEPFYRNQCYIDLAKKTKDESYCEKIEALPGGTIEEARAISGVDCYAQLAILKSDSSLCEKVESLEGIYLHLSNWCKAYFKEPSDFRIFSSEKYGFEVTYPKDWKCDEITLGHGGYFYQDGISCEKITDVDDIHFQILKSEPPFYFEKKKVTFGDFIIKSKQYLEKTQRMVKQENVTLDNVSAVKFSFESTPITHYLTKYNAVNYEILSQKEGNMYIVEIEINSPKLSTYKPIFEQILFTFRFLE